MSAFHIAVVCFTLSLCTLAGCGSSPEQVSSRHLESGKLLMQKHDYLRAALEFRNSLQAVHQKPEPHYQLALSLLAVNQTREAVAELRKTIELDPQHSDAQLKLASLMVSTQDFQLTSEAAAKVAKVLLERPGDKDVLFLMAATQIQLGRLDQAEKYLSESLLRHPEELRSSVALARMKVGAGDLAGAEAILKSSVQRDPEATEPLVALGVYYVAVNKPVEAEATYRKVLKKEPGHPSALYQLGTLQALSGSSQAAEETYRHLSQGSDRNLRSVYAIYLFQTGKLELAIAEFKRLAALDPEDRLARGRLISAYIAGNRLPEAHAVLTEALQRNAKDVDALLQRGRIRLARAEVSQAAQDLNVALSLRPDSAELHYLLAAVQQARGNVHQRREALTRALQLDPAMLQARLALAELLLSIHQPGAALDVLSAAPLQQHSDALHASLRNWALIGSGDRAAAGQSIEAALKKARTPEPLLQSAVLKMGARDFKGAQLLAEEALGQNPEDVRALKIVALTLEAREETGLALKKLQLYGAQRPNSAPLQLFVGNWLSEHGERQAARASLERAASADPNSIGPQTALANLDLVEGRTDQARTRLSSVLSIHPRDASARLLLATAEDSRRNYSQAAQHYLTVLESDPGNVLALNNLASIYLNSPAKLDDALRYAEKAKELAPDNLDVIDTLAWTLYRKGMYRRALAEFESARNRDDRPVVRYHLGLTYLKLGEKIKGTDLMNAALRKDPTLSETEGNP